MTVQILNARTNHHSTTVYCVQPSDAKPKSPSSRGIHRDGSAEEQQQNPRKGKQQQRERHAAAHNGLQPGWFALHVHPIPSRSSQSQCARPIRPEDACKPHIPSFPVWLAVTTSHPHLSHPITPCGSKSAPLQPARSGLSCELALQHCNTTPSGYRHWIAQKLPTMNHDPGTPASRTAAHRRNPPEREIARATLNTTTDP